MPKYAVNYRRKGKNLDTWTPGNTIVDVGSLEEIENYLLSKNPNFTEVRIDKTKLM